MKKDKSNITISLLYETQNIISELGWDNGDVSSTYFNKYCDMLKFFSDDQQKLILELTRKFLRIGMAEYISYINKALSKIEESVFDDCGKVYILPLLHLSDFGKPKSGTIISYMFKDHVIREHNVFKHTNTRPVVIETPDGFPRNINDTPNMILFVDDFIGSGENAISSINSWITKYGISKNKIKVLSFIAQEAGISKIKSMEIDVYYSLIQNKGISDSYTGNEFKKRLDIMKGIEDLLKVKEEYRFGYNHSEALVSLTRTPNNTFPVFWLSKKKLVNDQDYNPPFPR